MTTPSRKQESKQPNRSKLRRDKGVVVHRRTTEKPVAYVSKLAVREGVSVIGLLRDDDEIPLSNTTKK